MKTSHQQENIKILLDNNIVFDYLMKRDPFYNHAKQLFMMIETGKIKGFLCANSVTTIFYILSRHYDKDRALQAIGYLLELFNICKVDMTTLKEAKSSNNKDFEDAVIIASAEQATLDFIVTRNVKDFKQSQIKVFTPPEMLALL